MSTGSPRPFASLTIGELVVLTNKMLTKARPIIGKIDRINAVYVWITVEGWRDKLRVARSTGQGTLHQVTYQAVAARDHEADRVRRDNALVDLRSALFIAEEALRNDDDLVFATTQDLVDAAAALKRLAKTEPV